ncbi:hypothetical protein BH11BAC2_BH11BAC2_07500 [soil metagenome]
MNPYFQQCCLMIFVRKTPNDLTIQHQELAKIIAGFPIHVQLFYEDLNAKADAITSLSEERILLKSASPYQQLTDAFHQAFEKGFRKVVMLESEVAGLLPKHLEEAFFSLKILEFSLGPRKNGGLYLLGMKQYEPLLFQDQLNNPELLSKTLIRNMGVLKMALYKLPFSEN